MDLKFKHAQVSDSASLFSDVTFPQERADLFFINRELIDLINDRIYTINTSNILDVLRLGFSPTYYPYVRVKGVNTTSKWTLKKIRLFKDTFFSSSTWPVKVITNLSLFFSLFALGIIIINDYFIFCNPGF